LYFFLLIICIQWFVNFCNLYLDQMDSDINIDIDIELFNFGSREHILVTEQVKYLAYWLGM
jgi:hypothetical protein